MPPHRLRTPFLLERSKDLDPVRQDSANVAPAALFVLTMPRASIVPEVLPLEEASWP
jgi:hypothetical protein